jgi:hypothetical protein
MPQYTDSLSKESKELDASNQNKETKKRKSNFLFLLLVLVWFFISGGMEGFFQSQTYTFGICGPHLMEPGKVRYRVLQKRVVLYLNLFWPPQ